MRNVLIQIMQAIRNAMSFVVQAVFRGGKWVLESVAVVGKSSYQVVGYVANGIVEIAAGLVPRATPKQPAAPPKANAAQASSPIDVAGALAVKAAARAMVQGSEPSGVDQAILVALRALDREHLEAVARAPVDQVTGLLAKGNAAPVGASPSAMLASLKADIAAGRISHSVRQAAPAPASAHAPSAAPAIVHTQVPPPPSPLPDWVLARQRALRAPARV